MRQAADRFARYLQEDGLTYFDWLKWRVVMDPRISCTLTEVGHWSIRDLCKAHTILSDMTAAGL